MKLKNHVGESGDVRYRHEEGAAMSKRGQEAADELFGLVEADFGHAHISDGIAATDPSLERVLNIARGSLGHADNATRKLRRFIKKWERLDERL